MRRRLGISVTTTAVHALLADRRRVHWAASVSYSSPDDLVEVFARLASDAPEPLRRARIGLGPDVARLRALDPAPPFRPSQARRHVALECDRLFRNGHGPLVTDARIVSIAPGHRVLVAAAASEDVVKRVVAGCEQAGLDVECIGPALEALPFATSYREGSVVLPTSSGVLHVELTRGRAWRVQHTGNEPGETAWHPSLAALHETSALYAAAFSLTRARPHLDLLPVMSRQRAERGRTTRLLRLAAIAAVTWAGAFVITALRYSAADRTAAAELATLAPRLNGIMVVRRDLDAAAGALRTMAAAEHRRSRHLSLLAELTRSLNDSITLASLRIDPDSTLRLSGYAPVADQAVVALERLPGLSNVHLESPPTRQRISVGTRVVERDQFHLVARLASRQ